jgi:hypothetical protein
MDRSQLVEKAAKHHNGKIKRYLKGAVEWARGLWQDIKSSTKTAKFWLEGTAVVAAVVYAGITFFMWRDSHKNFVTDERAWLQVESLFPVAQDLKENSPIRATVRFRNTGKTFGKQIISLFVVSINKLTEHPSFHYEGHRVFASQVGIVPPNGIYVFDVLKMADDKCRPATFLPEEGH